MLLPSGDHAGAVSVASSRAIGVNLYRDKSLGRDAISHAASAMPAATLRADVSAIVSQPRRGMPETVRAADSTAVIGCALLDPLWWSRTSRSSRYKSRVVSYRSPGSLASRRSITHRKGAGTVV